MQTVFDSASEWLHCEGKRRTRPAAFIAYALFFAALVLGLAMGASAAAWFQPIAFAPPEASLVAYLVFAVFALGSPRVYGKLRGLVQSVADRSLREERAALGDGAWRRSAEMSCRIVLKEVERFYCPVRPEFDLPGEGDSAPPAGARPLAPAGGASGERGPRVSPSPLAGVRQVFSPSGCPSRPGSPSRPTGSTASRCPPHS